MRRRDFLKTATTTGMVLGGLLPRRTARAASDTYAGPVLLTIQALGGWDPTMFCDGKSAGAALELPYSAPTTVGSFACAPLSLSVGSTVLEQVPKFFSDLGSRLLVINGIDTQTNSHKTGIQRVWSGKASGQGPTLAALFAASKLGALKLPASYISVGGVGYDGNAGIVPVARLNSTQQLSVLAAPNKIDASGATFHDPDSYALIQAAVLARQQRAAGHAVLPLEHANLSGLISARAAIDGLKNFSDRLGASPVTIQSAFPGLGNLVDAPLAGYLNYAQTALMAFATGVSISANITTDRAAFDTHANHDVLHAAEMGRLLTLLRYIFQVSDQLGLTDRLYIVVGSDFGRAPKYNAAHGKDHWSVTSMVLAGPGIRAGRVVGGTDDQLRPLRVDPKDASKRLEHDDPTGVALLPEHVLLAFRQLAKIQATDVSLKYPLSVQQALGQLL